MDFPDEQQASANIIDEDKWHKALRDDILECLHNGIEITDFHSLKLKLWDGLRLDSASTTESCFLDSINIVCVYDLMLESMGSVYRTLRKLVECSIDYLDDWSEQVENKMEWLRQAAIVQEIRKEGALFGRDQKIEELMSLMQFDAHNSIRLVNVCGAPGIGKSFLVNQLRCKLASEHTTFIYVNCDNVKTVEDMLQKLLNNLNIAMDAHSLSYLLGKFCDFLLQHMNDPFVLVLDDITSLIVTTLKSTKLFGFFNEILTHPKMSNTKLKVLVTGETRLGTKYETSPLIVKGKVSQDLKTHIHDFPLERLPNVEMVKFLGPQMQNSKVVSSLQLVEFCDGNALVMRVINELTAEEFLNAMQTSQSSSPDIPADFKSKMFVLYRKAFDNLTALQRLVLLAVAVFENEASIAALNYMVSPNESYLKFSSRIYSAFYGGCWLKFPFSGLRMYRSLKSEVVHLFHPLVREFLYKMADEDQATFTELKKHYITYYTKQMVDIGKECVPEQPVRPDFLKLTRARVLDNLVNFKNALRLLENDHSPIPFYEDWTIANQRDCSDIAYLVLALCQFHDWFDGYLMNTVQSILSADNAESRVLLQTLHRVLLALDENWTDLEVFLGPHNTHTNFELIREASPGLYFLCEGLQAFTTSAFYAQNPSVNVEVNTPKKKPNESSHLPEFWKPVQVYFSIHTLLAKAKSVYVRNTLDLSTIQQAFTLCQEAKDYCTAGHILEPTVHAKMAYYKTAEGNAYLERNDNEAAIECYKLAACCHKSVCDQLKSNGMDKGMEAGHNYSKYAHLLRNNAWVRAKKTKSEDTTRTFLLARNLGAKATAIFNKNSFTSTSDLLTTYVHMGICYRDLTTYHHRLPAGADNGYSHLLKTLQNQALKFYGLAYGLLKDDFRKCHLKVDDWRLKKVKNHLVHLMNVAGRDARSVECVKENIDVNENVVALQKGTVKMHSFVNSCFQGL